MADSLKITFNADPCLKETIEDLKNSFNFKSISAVIATAVEEYKHKKDLEKLKASLDIASKDKEIVNLLFKEDFCDDYNETV